MKKAYPSRKLEASGLPSMAAALAASSILLCGLDAQAVGVHKFALVTTPSTSTGNFISAPLHKPRVWRGTVESVAGNVITVSGVTLPAGLGRRDGNGTLNPAGFAQCIVILRWDASATYPANGNAGDWWSIDSSTGTTLTVTSGLQAPSASLAVGDRVEVLPLTSLRDVFGGPGGPTTILNKDSNGAASIGEEDVIFFTSGTSFSTDIIFHNGALTGGIEGYIVAGDGPFDGQFITLGPDQAVFVFRKNGTANVNAFNAGHAHRAPLSHLFSSAPGSASVASTFGTGFPANAAIGASSLQSSGIIEDSNGAASIGEEDVMFEVTGTSFSTDIIRHDGTLNGGVKVWIEAGNPDDNYPLQSGRGHYFFRRPNQSTLVWRQAVPFRL